jgi:hypothetical protein
MDPYLEAHWRDIHHHLITYIRDAIDEGLPAQLRARVEERVVMETPEGWSSRVFPDVRVVEDRPQRQGGAATAVGVETAEPLLLAVEPLTEGYIEIIDASSGNRIVTVIEVLSPTNKIAGDGRQEYLRKQGEIVKSDTNLVEIDLVRAGQYTIAVPLAQLPINGRTPYMVCVRRATQRGTAEYYPIFLNQRLPTVKVPLRPTDADVPLALQPLIEQCYRKGRYEMDIDYRRDLEPPFIGEGAEWVAELLRSRGLRPAEPRKKKKRKRKPPE